MSLTPFMGGGFGSPFDVFRTQLDDLMGDWENAFFGTAPMTLGTRGTTPMGTAPETRRTTPRRSTLPQFQMDFIEEKDKFVLLADLPGITASDIKVDVDDDANMLNIAVDRKPEARTDDTTFHFQERRVGNLQRRVRLPANVDRHKVESSFDHGVLRLTFGKSDEAKHGLRTIKLNPESA